MFKEIKNNFEKYDETNLINVNISFHPKDIMNLEMGGLELTINIEYVESIGENIAISRRDNDYSTATIYYSNVELEKFKYSDIKKIAKVVYEKTIKRFNIFTKYHYKDIKKYL